MRPELHIINSCGLILAKKKKKKKWNWYVLADLPIINSGARKINKQPNFPPKSSRERKAPPPHLTITNTHIHTLYYTH